MENNKNIAAKLVKVMQACGGYIQKDAENKKQNYKYVSAAAVMEKVNPALVENNMVSIPVYSVVSEREKSTSGGGLWQLVTVQLELKIIDVDSGESVAAISLGTGYDPGDKAVAKAQTMALKYAWLTALNMGTGDEPEADENTDKQTFVNAPLAPQAPAPMMIPAGLPNSPTVTELCQNWQSIGWDTYMLPNYLAQRFSKPAIHLTEPELMVILNESRQYCQQKGATV